MSMRKMLLVATMVLVIRVAGYGAEGRAALEAKSDPGQVSRLQAPVGNRLPFHVTYLPLNTVSRCNQRIKTSIFDFTRQATI